MFCLNFERDRSLSICKQFYENIFRNYILYCISIYWMQKFIMNALVSKVEWNSCNYTNAKILLNQVKRKSGNFVIVSDMYI